MSGALGSQRAVSVHKNVSIPRPFDLVMYQRPCTTPSLGPGHALANALATHYYSPN
ncbi:BQ5605_C017g08445 [Microbotryum silenes-dioicae]|uniref:BQ5605_C017g08445 protein n=1 Tax=Microbotryum silenes-dioicae TaxID=796604 RepID=A0A2X0LYQ0_9BASI|nr:BQ5605_C017g08445 [Microbotryum silenes-dioicae]